MNGVDSAQQSRGLGAALAASLALHALLLASTAPPPRTQPRYAVLEARLRMPEAPPGSDFLTGAAFTFPLAAGPQGPLEPQSPTAPKPDAVRAISDATLPHDAAEAREFAPGADRARLAPGLLELPLPEPARYYRADELDWLAVPLAPIVFDHLRLLARGPIGTLRLSVYINEGGGVDKVELEEENAAPAALAEAVRREFLNARFAPALRQGRAVKSLKRIEVVQDGG